MMNQDLIEVLGGYEKAKNMLEAERQSENIDPVIYVGGDEILIDVICDALLQYRIEHGIFEVGDLVVPIAKPIALDENKVQTVGAEDVGAWYMRAWRHATPQEIKTGHRIELSGISGQLEVLEMIRISPSCVVIER